IRQDALIHDVDTEIAVVELTLRHDELVAEGVADVEFVRVRVRGDGDREDARLHCAHRHALLPRHASLFARGAVQPSGVADRPMRTPFVVQVAVWQAHTFPPRPKWACSSAARMASSAMRRARYWVPMPVSGEGRRRVGKEKPLTGRRGVKDRTMHAQSF